MKVCVSRDGVQTHDGYCTDFSESQRKGITMAYLCDECGSDLVVRDGQHGKFLGCLRYPDCRFTRGCDSDGLPVEAATLVADTTNDEFRRHAALELFKTLLADPSHRKWLWDRYIVDRSEAKLAVEMADDLVRELQ